MEADIKRLARRKGGDDSDDEGEQAQKKARSGQSALEQELAKYRNKSPKSKLGTEGNTKKRDENDLLARLEQFKGKLRQRGDFSVDGSSKPEGAGDSEAKASNPDKEAEMDVDKDHDWIGHRLNFPKGNEEEVSRAEHDYEVIDPRARGAQARQQELERKRVRKSNVGSSFRRGM
jgi:peptidyl-prolyl cis-trans isomerase SDCCAG10